MNMYCRPDAYTNHAYMYMYVYRKMYTCNERYFLMFLECNNHEAHGPTDYHAYTTISKRQKQILWTYVMCVLTSATDSFNIHTSLVWLDPSLSLRIHVNGNYNGNYHVRTHAIQHMEREGSSHTRLHTHMSVHCGYGDMMSILYMCWYRIDISHYIRFTCGHSNSSHTMYERTHTRTLQ